MVAPVEVTYGEPAHPAPDGAGDAGPMSEADRAHWEQVRRWRARRLPGPGDVPGSRGWLDGTRRAALTAVRMLPVVDLSSPARTVTGLVATAVEGVVGDAVAGALDGASGVLEAVGVIAVTERLGEAGVAMGRAGLHAAGVVATLRRAGHDVAHLDDVAGLDLDDLLAARPALEGTYVLAAAVSGGATALVPGLGALLGRWGPVLTGAANLLGSAAGASVDTVLTAATCTRAVTLVGAYYGYDPAGPDDQERAIALAVMSVSLTDGDERRSADQLLAGLQTGRPVPPRLTREVTAHLGARLRHRELVRVMPLVGAAVAAWVAGRVVARLLDDADHLYRERFLRERYGLPPAGAPDVLVVDAVA